MGFRLFSQIGCTKCNVVKNLLMGKNVVFEEVLINNLSEEDKEGLFKMTEKYNIRSTPFILDEGDNLITLKDF